VPWSADVVIVGSGVAGSLVAARLAKAGVRVVILEAGPRVQRNAALAVFRDAVIKTPESPYPDLPYAPHPRVEDPNHYYLQNGPDLFGGTYLRQVGGTTWHWLGIALRFVPDDFRLRTKFGVGVDWPISYDDLEPWYCEAERELGVAGDNNAELQTPRSQPYPLPPIPLSYSDQRIAHALAGTPHTVQPTPQARNSRAFDNRPACCGAGNCIPICPVQAKYDATSHVAKAEQAGAQLVPDAVASHVEIGADGRVAWIAIKRPDGTEDRAVGKVYVIAAHAIETPKLLLQSRSDRAPAGVANSSDQVGRNLKDHPCWLTYGLAGELLGPLRGPISTGGIEWTRAGDWRAEYGAFRIHLDNRGWNWPTGAPESTARDFIQHGLRGAALDRAIADHCARQFNIAPMVEQLPHPENRIVPDFDQRDTIGIPRPRITYRIDDYARRALERGRRVAHEIAAGLKATEVHDGAEIQSSGHVIGTCRMGSHPRDSVVDADQRAHDHLNLFLLGSSVFPTEAASNPTLTIAALALRAVESIRRTIA